MLTLRSCVVVAVLLAVGTLAGCGGGGSLLSDSAHVGADGHRRQLFLWRLFCDFYERTTHSASGWKRSSPRT